MVIVFFVKQKTAYEIRISDWSSDVCSSDLFANDLPPEIGESVVRGHVGRRVGPAQILRMRQRHVARAEIVHLAQHREARSDRMATLHAEHPRDLARLHRLFEFGRGRREHEIVRIARHEPLHHVDLRSEAHTSELQSLMRTSYAVLCLKKKKTNK